MKTYTMIRAGEVNAAALTDELQRALGIDFSLGVDGDVRGDTVITFTTEFALETLQQSTVEQVVVAHDSSVKTETQITAEQRGSLQQLASVLIAGIDFATLDAQIETMTAQEMARGLYRAIYLLAVAVGLTNNTEQAETAARELGQYFGLIEAERMDEARQTKD